MIERRIVRRYAAALFACTSPGDVVLADFNTGALLRLVQETSPLGAGVHVVPTAVDDALARDDPARPLLVRARAEAGAAATVVLADRYEPYYRIDELERRFGAVWRPCGPGAVVTLPR